MNLSKLFKLAEPIVFEVERKGKKVGASGAQKRKKAVEALSQEIATKVNDAIDLPEFVEGYTDDALGFAVDGVLFGLNQYMGKAWGSRLDLTQQGGRTGVSFEIKF